MKVEFNDSFLKDLKAVRDKVVLAKVKKAIETIESAETLDQISNLKKMRGPRDYFRVRVGDFRLGLKLDNDTLIFIRFLNRKDIYRYFP